MPIVFIHGVNTRIDESYHDLRRERGDRIKKYLIPQLPKPYSDMCVVDPYWGDHGARAGSNVLLPTASGGGAEAFGSDTDAQEGHQDLNEILESLRETWAQMSESANPQDDQMNEQVTRLLWNLIQDASLEQKVRSLKTREQALGAIDEVLNERLSEARAAEKSSDVATVETYGLRDFASKARTALNGLLSHPAVRRPVSVTIASHRGGLHKRFAGFFGDVFVYLKARGNSGNPGDIIKNVLAGFTPDNEPTLVVTHSMGGNIFYDIVTHFAPNKKIAGWLSVAGQVAFFEYQRLFLASEETQFTGQKVKKPIEGPWLNVYDPIDPFAFLAEPVFNDVKDFPFDTGSSVLNAHSDYFIREDFYKRAGVRFGELLK